MDWIWTAACPACILAYAVVTWRFRLWILRK